MTVLSGQVILSLNLIEPQIGRTTHDCGLTYGAGPAGYDVRVNERVDVFPNEFVLASTLERIVVPDWLQVVVHDKSTWARRGLALQNTLLDPGFRGHVTLELSNHSQEHLVVEAGMPIAQFVFHRVEGVVVPYDGRYQDAKPGPQPPIMKRWCRANGCHPFH